MDVREALLRNRSRRRFYQDYIIPENDLMTIADAARLSPSGRNIQALKFLISSNQHLNSRIFPTLAWAGYLTEWPGPEEGERPYAYIIQLLDKSITPLWHYRPKHTTAGHGPRLRRMHNCGCQEKRAPRCAGTR